MTRLFNLWLCTMVNTFYCLVCELRFFSSIVTYSIPEQYAMAKGRTSEIANKGLTRRNRQEKWYQLARASPGGLDCKHH